MYIFHVSLKGNKKKTIKSGAKKIHIDGQNKRRFLNKKTSWGVKICFYSK